MRSKSVLGLLGVFIVAFLGIAGWVWSETQLPADLPAPTVEPRGDVLLSEFYATPDNLPEKPGYLIQTEPLLGKAVLDSAAENIRLLYSSTDGMDGSTINSISGALYLPEGEAPEGGWPLLVWSHGTVGIGDICAPSFAGRGTRDPQYLNPWLEAGYAIAASDYQGLGTPGTHPYMDARVMAYNNLDLMRALKASEFPLASQVIITGQSQGATGALSTASYAESYAPDVNLAGVIATGIPYFSPSVMWELAAQSDRDAVAPSVPLSLYMLAYAEMLDPEFKLANVVSKQAEPVVEKIADMCVFEFVSAAEEAELSSNSTFTASIELAAMKVFGRAGLYDLDFATPVFTGSGTADIITPFSMQTAFLESACEAGLTLSSQTYEGANHNEGLLQSISDAQAFADKVLAGEAIANTCPN